MIVSVAEMTKTFGDSFQSRSFGLLIQGVVGIGPVDNLAQKDKRGVASQLVFFQDRLERTFLAVVTQFDVFSRRKEWHQVALLRPSPYRVVQK
jgi:hypothetical protein